MGQLPQTIAQMSVAFASAQLDGVRPSGPCSKEKLQHWLRFASLGRETATGNKPGPGNTDSHKFRIFCSNPPRIRMTRRLSRTLPEIKSRAREIASLRFSARKASEIAPPSSGFNAILSFLWMPASSDNCQMLGVLPQMAQAVCAAPTGEILQGTTLKPSKNSS